MIVGLLVALVAVVVVWRLLRGLLVLAVVAALVVGLVVWTGRPGVRAETRGVDHGQLRHLQRDISRDVARAVGSQAPRANRRH